MKYRVNHYPQIPCKPYQVGVGSLKEAYIVSQTLAYYDLFLLENNHRRDYANMTTVQVYNKNTGEWEDWYDEDGNDFDEWARRRNEQFGVVLPEAG